MNIENYIVKIINSSKKDSQPIIIALAGAGRIGKTTLANKLQKKFGASICEVIHLDGYMMDKKSAKKLRGYDPKRSDLKSAKKDIKGLIHYGRSFNLPVYNHETHKHDSSKIIKPLPVIILDGCFSLRSELLGLTNIRIFLDASEEVQSKLKQKCEQCESSFSQEKFEQKMKNYIKDYKKYILSTKKRAHIILETDANYKITLKQK